jgi:hypothetical protein
MNHTSLQHKSGAFLCSLFPCVHTCAGYLDYLFENDVKKGRTEGLRALSEEAEEESAMRP